MRTPGTRISFARSQREIPDLLPHVLAVANWRTRPAFAGNRCATTLAQTRRARRPRYLPRTPDFASQVGPRRAPTVCYNDRILLSTSRSVATHLLGSQSPCERPSEIHNLVGSRH